MNQGSSAPSATRRRLRIGIPAAAVAAMALIGAAVGLTSGNSPATSTSTGASADSSKATEAKPANPTANAAGSGERIELQGAGSPVQEAIPAFNTPIGLQSWPHGACAGVLDIPSPTAAPAVCSGRPDQRFYLRPVPGPGQMELENQGHPGLCLDSNGNGDVYATGCNGKNAFQHWTMVVNHRPQDGRAVLNFQNAVTQRWLAVKNVGSDDGANALFQLRTMQRVTFDRDFAIVR